MNCKDNLVFETKTEALRSLNLKTSKTSELDYKNEKVVILPYCAGIKMSSFLRNHLYAIWNSINNDSMTVYINFAGLYLYFVSRHFY